MIRRALARDARRALALLAAVACGVPAAPLPDLPGTDVSQLPPPPATDSAVPDTSRTGIPASGRPSAGKQPVGQWLTPAPEIQIERDETLLSLGEGAIFVPTMTEGRLEPQVVVDSADRTVRVGPAGQRIRVSPGSYVVRVGSGSEEQRMRFRIDVDEGRTSALPAAWSGLTIRTIDPSRQYVRGEYRLIRTDDFQSYGEGFGMPEERQADAPTWILPPGVYKIVGPSSGFEELTNFVTVRLLPGEYIDYTLVLQEDENGIQRIVGGGMLSIAPENRRFRDWTFSVDAGGSLSWSQEVLPNQQDRRRSLSLSGLLQVRARREKNAWVTNLRGFYLGGASRTDSKRLSISPDELDGQLFLSRRLTPRFGPYLRLIAESHVFPTMIDLGPAAPYHRLYEYHDDDTSFTLLSADREEYELAPPLLPIELREGAGLNFDLLNALNFELSILVGGAARQTVAGNSLVETVISDSVKLARLYASDPLATDTNVVFAQRATSQTFTGLEGALDLRARYRSLSLSLTPEVFYSLQPRGELELRAISILSFRISRYLHTDYRFTIRRNLDEEALHRYPSTHQVLLRFSFVL